MKLYKSPHDFLLLNLKYKRLFYDWNEILFEDGEDKKPSVYNIDKYAEETKTKAKAKSETECETDCDCKSRRDCKTKT